MTLLIGSGECRKGYLQWSIKTLLSHACPNNSKFILYSFTSSRRCPEFNRVVKPNKQKSNDLLALILSCCPLELFVALIFWHFAFSGYVVKLVYQKDTRSKVERSNKICLVRNLYLFDLDLMSHIFCFSIFCLYIYIVRFYIFCHSILSMFCPITCCHRFVSNSQTLHHA